MLSDTELLELVSVVKTTFSGREETLFLTPLEAVQEIFSAENGVTVKLLKIVWGNISSRTLDTSGGSFAAEYGSLRLDDETDTAGEINWK